MIPYILTILCTLQQLHCSSLQYKSTPFCDFISYIAIYIMNNISLLLSTVLLPLTRPSLDSSEEAGRVHTEGGCGLVYIVHEASVSCV